MIDLLPAESWETVCEHFKSHLKLDDSFQLRVYPSLSAAIFEVCVGIGQLYSHKKNVAVMKGMSNDFQSLMPFLLKESYQVQSFESVELQNLALKNDTNFVLFNSDHPVTAELSDWKKLDEELNAKKIFSIRVSHADWLEKIQVSPYSVQIISVDQDFAFAVFGGKFKAGSFFAQKIKYDFKMLCEKLDQLRKNFLFDKNGVLAFENSLPKGWVRLCEGSHRLFDRSVIYNLEVNAEYIYKKLMQKYPGLVDTTSLCKWKFDIFSDWWAKVTPEILRGLLIISARALQNKNFQSDLERLTTECQNLVKIK